jgi:hypothetical protein
MLLMPLNKTVIARIINLARSIYYPALVLMLRHCSAVNTRLASEASAKDGLKNIPERSKKSFNRFRTSAGKKFQAGNYRNLGYNTLPFDTSSFVKTTEDTQGERGKKLTKQKFSQQVTPYSARPECPARGVSKGLSALLLLLACFTISLGQSTPRLITYTAIDSDPYTKEISIQFTIPKKDFIYKDFITCSVDNPAIHLSPWKADKQSVAHYDSSFKEAKQIFNENFTITMIAILRQAQDERVENKSPTKIVYLYCSYYRKSEKKINHLLFPLLFTATAQAPEEYDSATVEIIENNLTPRTKQKINYLDNYSATLFYITHHLILSLHTDYKKYFSLLIFLILVFISFLYFFKKELATQIKIRELIEIIISLLIVLIISYMLLCIHTTSTTLTTTIMACFCSLYAGFFYTKKSTQLQSARLRTFCTFIGMLCICSALFLSFKLLQHADDQFNLLQ